MKKLFLILMFVLFIQLPVWAIERPQITVYGKAAMKVVPDEMYWSFTYKNQGKIFADITSKHIDDMKVLLKILKDQGIQNKKIKTTRMQYGKIWNRNKQGRKIQDGFYASTHVSFKLTDLDKYESLWILLGKFDGVSLENISYGFSKYEKMEELNKINALLDAKNKATAMALTLSEDPDKNIIGKTPILIEEIPSGGNFRPQLMKTAMYNAAESSQSFAPGEIEIKSEVRVSYPLMDPVFE